MMCATRLFALALLAGCSTEHAKGSLIPEHAKFSFKEGVISAVQDPKLRLNVAGGDLQSGDPLILWPCSPHAHEQFLFDDGLIRLATRRHLCLNAAGGASTGAKIVLYPCEHDGRKQPHEEFAFASDGRIHLKQDPKMCINIEGGNIQAGSQLILYPCSKGEANEVFTYEGGEIGGYIKVKNRPELHFNVEGSIMEPGSNVKLWSCQAASHEVFIFSPDNKLRIEGKKDLCVNAEGGLGAGARLIAYPCTNGTAENEDWVYDPRKQVIHSVHQPLLGFNVKEASVQQGTEIVVWPLEETGSEL